MTADPLGRPPWGGRLAARLTALTLAVKGDRCHLCGLRGATTADHVLPRSLGGLDDLDNLEPAHQACNSARGTMTLAAWHARHPAAYAATLAPSRSW